MTPEQIVGLGARLLALGLRADLGVLTIEVFLGIGLIVRAAAFAAFVTRERLGE